MGSFWKSAGLFYAVAAVLLMACLAHFTGIFKDGTVSISTLLLSLAVTWGCIGHIINVHAKRISALEGGSAKEEPSQ